MYIHFHISPRAYMRERKLKRLIASFYDLVGTDGSARSAADIEFIRETLTSIGAMTGLSAPAVLDSFQRYDRDSERLREYLISRLG